jgi:uncharacterized protein (TIGR01777 family)
MRVAITGSSGFLGSAMVEMLHMDGHEVVRLVRGLANRTEIAWNPCGEVVDADSLAGVDAVIHLAGEPIDGYWWTKAKRRRIRDSRVLGTANLVKGLVSMKKKPGVFISVTGISYYGDRGDEYLDEESPAGGGFLSGIAADWEAATQSAADAGIRVVILRIAPVVSASSPFVTRLRLPITLGLGAWFGSGRQYWPWLTLKDVVGICQFALAEEHVRGPLIAAVPDVPTCRALVKTMGRTLGRPVLFGLPAPLLRVVLGDLARDMLLSSQRVCPRALLTAGYEFKSPDLETALREALGRGEVG